MAQHRRNPLALVVIAGMALALAACGDHDTPYSSTPNPPAASGQLSLLAGDPGGPGNTDGSGSAARFLNPGSLATDSAGNIYVVDGVAGVPTDQGVIRKVTPQGVVTTLAYNTHAYAIATDSAGNLYTTDANAGTVSKITPDGVVTVLAGLAAGLKYPTGVATDSTGNVYVADLKAGIFKITPADVVTTFAGPTSFSYPNSVATDTAGNVYVADSSAGIPLDDPFSSPGNNTILKITPTGVVTTLAGTAGVVGNADGTGPAASFNTPGAIATDPAGNLYVADLGNNVIRKVTPAGVVTTLAGTAGVATTRFGATKGLFTTPGGITTDSAGDVYFSDHDGTAIRKLTPGGVVTTLAGSSSVTGSVDGTGAAARFTYPAGIAADSTGNIYVADSDNNNIRIITAAGVVTTLAGTAGVTGSADGTGAAASFDRPIGIAADLVGNLYVADNINNAIRKITPAGVVTTLAQNLGQPTGVAVDSMGNIYVVSPYAVSKITPSGVVSTLAAVQGSSAYPPFARGTPVGIAVDSGGNVYVTVWYSGVLVKITPMGQVTTLASGFVQPMAVAVDSADNLYVADSSNHTISKVTTTGVVTTVVGQAGMEGFSPGPLPGVLAEPDAVAISGTTLYTTTGAAIVQVTNVP